MFFPATVCGNCCKRHPENGSPDKLGGQIPRQVIGGVAGPVRAHLHFVPVYPVTQGTALQAAECHVTSSSEDR